MGKYFCLLLVVVIQAGHHSYASSENQGSISSEAITSIQQKLSTIGFDVVIPAKSSEIDQNNVPVPATSP